MTKDELDDILRAIEAEKTDDYDLLSQYTDHGLTLAQHVVSKYFKQQEEKNNGKD